MLRSLLAVVLLMASAFHSANAANPLQQVVTMLSDMLKDCETNAKTEEVDMVEKEGQCKNNIEANKKSIDADTQEVEKQEAVKGEAEAQARSLAAEIATLEARLLENRKQTTDANATRTKETIDNQAMLAELEESIKALKQAMEAVGKVKGAKEMPTAGAALLQVLSSNLLSIHEKALVESFVTLGQSENGLAPVTPEAKAYESQTGGVLGLLEKLLFKFQDQFQAAEKEEKNSGFAYAKLIQTLGQQAKADESTQKSKEEHMASAKEKAAEAAGNLERSSKSLAQGETSLEDLQLACKTELAEFKQNQKVRVEEIKAIQTAIAVLGEAGSVEPAKWSEGFLQNAATALLQVRGGSDSHENLRRQASRFIQERASKLNSRSLMLVAKRIAKDPLEGAKKMIKALILKMMTSAEVDTEEKAYCDKEMAVNTLSRAKAQAAVEDQMAQLEAAEAAVGTLGIQISEKSSELKELRKALAEATELRQKTKADNIATIKDARQSQLAVEKAIKTLRNFYAKPETEVLLQSDDSNMLSEAIPNPASGPYSGQDSGSRIIGLLETVLGDFSKLEADTDNEEGQAQSDYEKFQVETEKTIAVSEEEKDLKVHERESMMQSTKSLKKDLQNAQDMLDAGLLYYEKLKPTCVDNADWQARIMARSEEIRSLQEALNMLNSSP